MYAPFPATKSVTRTSISNIGTPTDDALGRIASASLQLFNVNLVDFIELSSSCINSLVELTAQIKAQSRKNTLFRVGNYQVCA